MNILSCFFARNASAAENNTATNRPPGVASATGQPTVLDQRAQNALDMPIQSELPPPQAPRGTGRPFFANTRAALKAAAQKFIDGRSPALTSEKLKKILSAWENAATTDSVRSARVAISAQLKDNFRKKHAELTLYLDSTIDQKEDLLPKEICLFKHLTSISIRPAYDHDSPADCKNLNLENLFSRIDKLSNLTSLNFCNIKLNEIPNKIFWLKNLNSLQLTDCNIKHISEDIKNLQKLEILNLNMNNIEFLPKKINLLKNLNSLSLNNNKLKYLPPLAKLQNLSSLDLMRNEMIALPEDIGQLLNLQFFNACNNPGLETLPASLLKLRPNVKVFLDDRPALLNALDSLYKAAEYPEFIPQIFLDANNWSSTHAPFTTIEQATHFWCELGNQPDISPEIIEHWKTLSDSPVLVQWLSRLRHCKDFFYALSKPALVDCINTLFGYLQSATTNTAEAFAAIRESLGMCTDRVLTGAGQVSLLQLRLGAAKTAQTSLLTTLECGITDVLFNYLRQRAALHAIQTKAVDPIETYLAYELHLGKLFKYLYTAQHMAYESHSQVGPVDLYRMLRHLLFELNHEGLRTYLYESDHWQSYFLLPIKEALAQADANFDDVQKALLEQNPDLSLEQTFENDAYKDAKKTWESNKAKILTGNELFNLALKEYIPESVRVVVEKCRPDADKYENLLSRPESKIAIIFEKLQQRQKNKEDYESEFEAKMVESNLPTDRPSVVQALANNKDKAYKILVKDYEQTHADWMKSKQAIAGIYQDYGDAVWTPISEALKTLPASLKLQA